MNLPPLQTEASACGRLLTKMDAKIREIWESLAGAEGKRWARPDAPILHDMQDEKEEPRVFYHNTNYRISRKYINVEKVKAR